MFFLWFAVEAWVWLKIWASGATSDSRSSMVGTLTGIGCCDGERRRGVGVDGCLAAEDRDTRDPAGWPDGR